MTDTTYKHCVRCARLLPLDRFSVEAPYAACEACGGAERTKKVPRRNKKRASPRTSNPPLPRRRDVVEAAARTRRDVVVVRVRHARWVEYLGERMSGPHRNQAEARQALFGARYWVLLHELRGVTPPKTPIFSAEEEMDLRLGRGGRSGWIRMARRAARV